MVVREQKCFPFKKITQTINFYNKFTKARKKKIIKSRVTVYFLIYSKSNKFP